MLITISNQQIQILMATRDVGLSSLSFHSHHKQLQAQVKTSPVTSHFCH